MPRIATAPTALTTRFMSKVASGAYQLWSDRLVVVLALPIVLPIAALLIVLIKLTSRGPAILRRNSVSESGTAYREYRFRCVWMDAHLRQFQSDATAASADRDPRVTPVGEFMLHTGLNTLPRLLNVLKGDIPLTLRSFK